MIIMWFFCDQLVVSSALIKGRVRCNAAVCPHDHVLADYFCYVKIGMFLSWLKDVANENLSGMVLVLFVKLEIGTRFLLVVGIGLLPVLLVLPLRRPFNIWCKEGAGNFGLDK
ncbi:hypothetical protein RGQ29_013796 [Quercus rubra]|uniref:Uncharacterized protein n=1 Tax=Quercus rubra TaxID=3512 RepID=A0AAN7FQ82_QUERU|nr:hypothetical protein RGQ29_013796 [Quercus rubra]